MQETPERPRPFMPPMSAGGGVRIISPAGPIVDRDALDKGREIMRRGGLSIIPPQIRRSKWGYLAGDDDERLAELMAAASAADNSAILAARGGYGCQRLLPGIDPEIFRANPRIICGASDVSILLNLISTRTGMITFHAPMATNIAMVDPLSRKWTLALLQGTPPPPPPPLNALHGKTARGQLLGGNLSVMTHLLGTPHAVDFSGAIVFFEDVNEPPYRLDRMFQQLRQSGALATAAAVVLGDFILNGEVMDPEITAGLAAEATAGKCAIFTGLACGHGQRNLPLPVGCECGIDDNGRVSFLYPTP